MGVRKIHDSKIPAKAIRFGKLRYNDETFEEVDNDYHGAQHPYLILILTKSLLRVCLGSNTVAVSCL